MIYSKHVLLVDKHAPLKKKVNARKHVIMNKKLSKAIMTRSKLKNKYNKNPTIGNNIVLNH